MAKAPQNYILGLDLGTSSVGWACIRCDGTGPRGLLAVGAHVFSAGKFGDYEAGIETTLNKGRRTARLMRRQLKRRARRRRRLLRLLISHGLLPHPLPHDTFKYFQKIDAKIQAQLQLTHDGQQNWLYALRAKAASEVVDRHELGRILYHLNQRRGFRSNRKLDRNNASDQKGKNNSETSPDQQTAEKNRDDMLSKISDLAARITANPTPTLGAYLASLDQSEQRLRGRYTHRDMYEHEFDVIWEMQRNHHALDDSVRIQLRKAIFHQRKVKGGAIGRCGELVDQPRASKAHRAFQRFRVLEAVNHLKYAENGQPFRALTDEERAALIKALEKGDLEWKRVFDVTKLSKGSFNLEKGKKSKLIGHRTDAKLREIFGDRFDTFTDRDRNRMVDDLDHAESAEALARRSIPRWGLTSSQARAFSETFLEEGYAPYSVEALRRLLPHMENGYSYSKARELAFPNSLATTSPMDLLPPILQHYPHLGNPTVIRTLTQVRRIVNELIRRYGKPLRIRVELARDIKNSKDRRKELHDRSIEQNRAKEEIIRDILRPRLKPFSSDDIEKVLLAKECGRVCPYTGKCISWDALLGPFPQFQVEHIWPFSKSLDNGWANKTLCCVEANKLKGDNIPLVAFGGDENAWLHILDRVRKFQGHSHAMKAKLARFMAEAIPADFTNRQLSDTRYIAAQASEYMGVLYRATQGSRVDSDGVQRVQVSTGKLTSLLRRVWGLEGLATDDLVKTRDDHRHHAVDAIVVALSDAAAVKAFADAAARSEFLRRRGNPSNVKPPWDGLRDEAKAAINKVIVSRRQSRKVSGKIHEDTNYSKCCEEGHRVRRELSRLHPSEINEGRIVDKRALEAIREALAKLGKKNLSSADIAQFFLVRSNAPLVSGPGGKMVRLRKVRVAAEVKPVRIDEGTSARFVKTANNHHTVIYEKNGRLYDMPVTLLECYRRKRDRQPIVCESLESGKKFVFSLCKGELIEIDSPNDPSQRIICEVISISKGDIQLQPHYQAIRAEKGRERNAFRMRPVDKLRKLRAKKVHITHLGEIRNAGG